MLTIKGSTATRNRAVTIPIMQFKGGVNKLLSESRIGMTEAKEAINLYQVEDGLWKTRPGTAYYGPDFGANPDGAAEYMKTDGTTEMIVIADGKAWKSTDGGSKTEVTGATFTAGLQCYFMQIAGYLYIANGTDPLAKYNGSTISTYSQLSAPTGTSASRIGLTSGSYTLYAEITAINAVGETTGSTEASIAINKPRDQWILNTDKINWTWNAVLGATAYQIYISDTAGHEEYVANSTATSFLDDGSMTINPYVTPPLMNTTTAPRFKSMCMSGNRMWATNDANDMYVVYYSGSGLDIGSFSEFTGGGWIALERGGREIPVAVKHYQSGGGDGRATVFCRTPEGQGSVWQLTIATATVGDTTFSIPSASKIVGSNGTDSILGTVSTNNDIMFPNKRGWNSIGPEKNYYGILRTNELSSRIRPYWRSLKGTAFSGICAYYKDAKIYISVPTSGTQNNRTIVYDLERVNWTVEWTIGAKQFFEYTDSFGNSHLLYIPYTGNHVVEIAENIQGDLGVAFNTSYYSGRWPITKYFKDFTKTNKVHIKLNAPSGKIEFEVLGTEKGKSFRSLVTKTMDFGSSSSNTGLGFDLLGTVQVGDTAGVPSFFADSSVQKYVKVRKKLRDIQFRISTTNYDAAYTLLGILVEGNTLKVNPPTSERLS